MYPDIADDTLKFMPWLCECLVTVEAEWKMCASELVDFLFPFGKGSHVSFIII